MVKRRPGRWYQVDRQNLDITPFLNGRLIRALIGVSQFKCIPIVDALDSVVNTVKVFNLTTGEEEL